MDLFDKRYHPPGTSPGTLRGHPVPPVNPTLRLIDYTDGDYYEQERTTAAECTPFRHRESVTWLHLCGGVGPETLREVGELFGLHPLALEDVLNTGQRPKVEEYDGQLFIIMALPAATEGRVVTEQVSLFVGKGFVVSVHCGGDDPFEPVRKRLRRHVGRIRSRREDYLLYALLDVIIDQGFPVLELFGEEVERLEEALLDHPERATMERIHRLRRELLLLRRMLWPQREIVGRLLAEESDLVASESRIYYRDCYDHTVQIMDLLESYREMAAGMLDVYLSSISNRLNEIMRVLTLISTIFIPLTFIAGVYGMNFGSESHSPWAMPELRWYYGYPLVWLVMIAVVVGMVLFFRRKRWL